MLGYQLVINVQKLNANDFNGKEGESLNKCV